MHWGECSLSGVLQTNIYLRGHDSSCRAHLSDWSETTCTARPVFWAQLNKCSQPVYIGMVLTEDYLCPVLCVFLYCFVLLLLMRVL